MKKRGILEILKFPLIVLLVTSTCLGEEAGLDLLSVETFKKASVKEKQEVLSQLTKLVYEKRGLPDPWATPKTPPKEPNTGAQRPAAPGDAKTPRPPFMPGAEWTPLLDHLSKDPLNPEILSSTQALFVAIGQWSPQCEAFCSNLERSEDPRLSGELYRVRDLIMALDGNGQVPLKKVVEIALRKGNPEDWKVLQARYGTSKEFKAELLLRIDPAHKPKPSITAILKLPEFSLTRAEFAAVVRAFAAAFKTANDANRRTLILQFQRTCEARFPEFAETLGPVEIEALQALLDSKNDWEKVLPIELVLACAKTVPPQFLVRAVTAMRDHKNLPAAGVLAGIGFVKHERNEESKAAAQALVPLAQEFRPDAQTGIYSYCRRVLGTDPSGFQLERNYSPETTEIRGIEANLLPGQWENAVRTNDKGLKGRVRNSVFGAVDSEGAIKTVELMIKDPIQGGHLLRDMVANRGKLSSWRAVPGLKVWLSEIASETSNETLKTIETWPNLSILASTALCDIFQDKSGYDTVIKNIRASKVAYIPKMLDQWGALTTYLVELDPDRDVLADNLALWNKSPSGSKEAWWGWLLAKCLNRQPNAPTITAAAKGCGSFSAWWSLLKSDRFGTSLEAYRHPVLFFGNLSSKESMFAFLGELDRLYFASQPAGKAGAPQLGEEEDKPSK